MAHGENFSDQASAGVPFPLAIPMRTPEPTAGRESPDGPALPSLTHPAHVAPTAMSLLAKRMAGALGLAIILGCVMGVHYKYSDSQRSASAESHATLFANPFDETEVFELQPGLTEDEAREIVGQLLIERAKERERSVASAR